MRRAEQVPQRDTVRGKDAVVVLSAGDYERLRPDTKITLAELMEKSPLGDVPFGEQCDIMPVRRIDL